MGLGERRRTRGKRGWLPLMLLVAAGCFEESDPVGASGPADSQTGTGAGTTGMPMTTTAPGSSGTGLDSAASTADPDATTRTGSEDTATDGEPPTDSTSGNAVWLCADVPTALACESFEPADGTTLWNEERVSFVTVQQSSEPTSHAAFRNHVLNGGDEMRGRISTVIGPDDAETVRVEFDVRFATDSACIDGSEADLTVLSLVRDTEANVAEQLILDVIDDHLQLWQTGGRTNEIVGIDLVGALNEWMHLALEVPFDGGTVTLEIAGQAPIQAPSFAEWSGADVLDGMTIYFGPASPVNGTMYNDCEFDLDNLVVYGLP